MVPTNLVHIVVGPGSGTWDRTNSKFIEQIKKSKESIEDILLNNNKAKLYGSLKFKDSKKGSVPVELVW